MIEATTIDDLGKVFVPSIMHEAPYLDVLEASRLFFKTVMTVGKREGNFDVTYEFAEKIMLQLQSALAQPADNVTDLVQCPEGYDD